MNKFLDLIGLSYIITRIKETFAPISHSHTKSDITDLIDSTEDFFKSVYPVGSIYISTSNNNPANLFGFGVWMQIKDTFLLAAGDKYQAGSTGGEESHVLSESEMPIHNHTFSNEVITNGTNGTETISNNTWFGAYKAIVLNNTEASGGGQAHNNMPPYFTVFMYERIE